MTVEFSHDGVKVTVERSNRMANGEGLVFASADVGGQRIHISKQEAARLHALLGWAIEASK